MAIIRARFIFTTLNILENAWTVLVMPGPWIYLIILHVRQALNLPGFWIRHSCICKGYAEFWICLNMAQYASVMPEYALMFLNMPEHGWVLLNVSICLNKLFWLCQGSQYASSSYLTGFCQYLTAALKLYFTGFLKYSYYAN